MELSLDPTEAVYLAGLVARRLEDLHREIHHTDARAFRAQLKSEAALLEALMVKLRTPALMGI